MAGKRQDLSADNCLAAAVFRDLKLLARACFHCIPLRPASSMQRDLQREHRPLGRVVVDLDAGVVVGDDAMADASRRPSFW